MCLNIFSDEMEKTGKNSLPPIYHHHFSFFGKKPNKTFETRLILDVGVDDDVVVVVDVDVGVDDDSRPDAKKKQFQVSR